MLPLSGCARHRAPLCWATGQGGEVTVLLQGLKYSPQGPHASPPPAPSPAIPPYPLLQPGTLACLCAVGHAAPALEMSSALPDSSHSLSLLPDREASRLSPGQCHQCRHLDSLCTFAHTHLVLSILKCDDRWTFPVPTQDLQHREAGPCLSDRLASGSTC